MSRPRPPSKGAAIVAGSNLLLRGGEADRCHDNLWMEVLWVTQSC